MTAAVVAGRLGRGIASLPKLAMVGLIRGYQLLISPLLGPRCKYYPSCSHYGLEAVRQHGAARGFLLAGWRVLRCNPWSYGGVDDVPAVGAHPLTTPLLRRRGAGHTPSTSPAST